MKKLLLPLLFLFTMPIQAQTTYAERLGYPAGKKVLILHVDDVGMSYDSNLGAIEAIENGVANSLSIMMPCPWVPGFVRYLKEHPEMDAGLHLTLTSEWDDYRWGPLAGDPAVPGLTDDQGKMHASVMGVVLNASADEVEQEIRAQVALARQMGFEPTHLDSHMGTLFATPAFMERYIKVGAETGIPVMLPGGHNHSLIQSARREAIAKGMDPEKAASFVPDQMKDAREMGEAVWKMGLPVLDDLENNSYGWGLEPGASDEEIQAHHTQKYIEAISGLKPGLTMVIMHCTAPTEVFPHISNSGMVRKGDLLAMQDPKLKAFLEKEGVILTTWREVMKRRKALMEKE